MRRSVIIVLRLAQHQSWMCSVLESHSQAIGFVRLRGLAVELCLIYVLTQHDFRLCDRLLCIALESFVGVRVVRAMYRFDIWYLVMCCASIILIDEEPGLSKE